eukprot:686339-Prymnesium_polylepis.1
MAWLAESIAGEHTPVSSCRRPQTWACHGKRSNAHNLSPSNPRTACSGCAACLPPRPPGGRRWRRVGMARGVANLCSLRRPRTCACLPRRRRLLRRAAPPEKRGRSPPVAPLRAATPPACWTPRRPCLVRCWACPLSTSVPPPGCHALGVSAAPILPARPQCIPGRKHVHVALPRPIARAGAASRAPHNLPSKHDGLSAVCARTSRCSPDSDRLFRIAKLCRQFTCRKPAGWLGPAGSLLVGARGLGGSFDSAAGSVGTGG